MKVVCGLCVLCGLALPSCALDREAFTFTRYDLNARIEREQQRLGVRGRIALRNDSGSPQKETVLQVSSTLHWSSIQFDGQPVEFVSQEYTSDIDHTGALSEAIVVLPRPVAAKQSIELEIGYEGIIPPDSTRLTRIGVPPDKARHSDWDQIGRTFTAVRGIGYVAWYPIATEAASLSEGNSVLETVGRWKRREATAEMNVEFSQTGAGEIPKLYCDGVSQLEGHEQMGQAYSARSRCKFWHFGYALPFFLVGSYYVLDRSTVDISFLSGHKDSAQDYALAIEQTLPFVGKSVGDHRDTPESKAQIIELPDASAEPFESGSILLMPLNATDETTYLLSAVQELTHLYFPSPQPWIADGLPRYAQVRYIEDEKGRAAAIAYLRGHRGTLIDNEKFGLETTVPISGSDRAAAHSLINSVDEFYVQTKAMNVWWMLRDMVGEAALTAALHNYKAGDDKGPNYMQKLIETQAHCDLAWFFDDWVYHDRGLPDFHIVSVYSRQIAKEQYMVTVTVENLGSAGAEVPVTLHMAEGETTERLLVPGGEKASIRIPAPMPPQEVTVNDGSVPEKETDQHVYRSIR